MDDVAEAINHFSMLMEVQNAKIEALVAMQEEVALIPVMPQDITELRQDMNVVKAAVMATNRDVVMSEHRVTRLEAA